MASWHQLQQEFEGFDQQQRFIWLSDRLMEEINRIGECRSGRNVIFYASGFLQHPTKGIFTQITQEDINGFMSVMHEMDWDLGLSLVLHTPGGVTNSTETIVEYLRSKFSDFEVIVPTYAMSAGTMISLASTNIVMARQSQLGPIDPQMQLGSGMVSAGATVAQFDRARDEITEDAQLAHLWAPVLQTVGPALLEEAQNALDYSEKIVTTWLESGVFKDDPDRMEKAKQVAEFFNDSSEHKSHGRRINREAVAHLGLNVEDLEDNQDLQDAVLTAYHLFTLFFGSTNAVKAMISNTGKPWVKRMQ